jgi:hypothetical protein
MSVPVGGSTDGNLILEGTITGQTSDPDLLADFINGTWFYVDTKSRYNSSADYAQGGAAPSNLVVDFTYIFNYAPTVVPEPPTFALAAVAGALFWAIYRRHSIMK